MSDAKPKLRELALELHDRLLTWAEVKAMAIQLDMEYTTLSNISTANQETSDRIVCAMDTWLKTDPRASWKKIVKALKATNKIVLAQEIEKKYALNAPSSSSTSTNDADTGSSIAVAGTVNPLLLTPGHTTTAFSASTQATSLSQKLAVNLSERETATHFTDSTHDVVVPETTESTAVTDSSDDEVKCTQLVSSSGNESSVSVVRSEIEGFNQRFNSMKESTIDCLEKCKITVIKVVLMLTSIVTLDWHRIFLKEKCKDLKECKTHDELFIELNFYWNYLAYDLFHQLIKELTRKYKSFESIAGEMVVYKKDLKKFRKRTTLKLFCQAVPYTNKDPPPGFRKMVNTHKWPDTITLEHVENFRKCFINTFNLQQCAMIVYSIRTGSFEVTWFVLIPDTVIEILKKSTAKIAAFQQYNVSMIVINEVCVFEASLQPQAQTLPVAMTSVTTDISTLETTSAAQIKQVPPLTGVSMATMGVSSLSIERYTTTDISSLETTSVAEIEQVPTFTGVSMATMGVSRLLWQFLGYRISLSLHIFYYSDSKTRKRATVVVTKDLAENVTALTEKFKDAVGVTKRSMICDYTTKEIALSPLPIEGSGWSVNSTFMPAKIDMEKITYYRPGTRLPNIELQMKWVGMGEPEDEEIEIQVDGGDIKSFTLYCGLMPPATGTDPRNIHRVLDIDQDLNYILDTLQNLNKEEIKSLGCRLGLSDSTVTNNESCSKKSYLEDIMRAWMMKRDNVVGQGEPTLDNLRKALEAEGQRGIVQENLHM